MGMAGNMAARQNGRTSAAARSSSARNGSSANASTGEDGLVSRLGPIEIDWPRSIGFFGGIGVAVGIGIIDPPIGLFIAAVPFLKMLNSSRAPKPSKFIGQVIEGVAKPVGGDSQGTVRLASAKAGANAQPVSQSG
jgi:hypothetical protein